MPPELQTRLLRVLSDGHFYRVGGHQPLKSNVRVIAATHQNLEERVRQGLFREDLFHRLNVIRLRLPALRERAEDIPLLVRHFMGRSARELGVEAKRLSDDALARLCGFGWPGNVRQLENVCHWLTVMAPGQTIEAKDLPPEVMAAEPLMPTVSVVLSDEAAVLSPWPVDAGGERGTATAERAAGLPRPATEAALVGMPVVPAASSGTPPWASLLEAEVARLLALQSARGEPPPEQSELMDQLTRIFESTLIRTALRHTRGRRIDAALRLGIGRNSITRKIQDLGLEDD
jgi:two-component system nitrogen regulation response regulator GlnG